MIDLEQEIEITLNPRNMRNYESKGYDLNSFRKPNGKIPRGTTMKVKLKDVPSNSHIKIKYICERHPEDGIKEIAYSKFNSGQGCLKCGIEKNTKRQRHSYDFIKFEFKKRKYKLISEKYKNNEQRLKYICLRHEEKGIQTITYESLRIGCGCYYCSIEKRSGKNHPNWSGGVSELNVMLRNNLKEFNKKSTKFCKYKCLVTNKRLDDVHHLCGFNIIVDEIGYKNNIKYNINKSFAELSKDELNNLKEDIIKEHENHIGICLSKPIHILFHKIYKSGNNTPQQFYKFIQELKQGIHNYYLIKNNITLDINEEILSKLFFHYNIEYNY